MKRTTLLAVLSMLVAPMCWGATYNWIGPDNGGYWSDLANWSGGGNGTYDKSVGFSKSATVVLDVNKDLQKIVLDEDVELTLVTTNDSTYIQFFKESLNGGRLLRVKNVEFRARGGSSYPTYAFTVPTIDVPAGNFIRFSTNPDNSSYATKTTTISSAFTGEGLIEVRETAYSGTKWKLTGNNSAFAGTFKVQGETSRQQVILSSPDAGSAYAAWIFEAPAEEARGVHVALENDGVIKFGSLDVKNGITNDNETAVTLEVGALNTDFSVAGNVGGMSFRKVGSGKMSFSGSNVGSFEVEQGAVYFAAGTTVSALTVADGAKVAIVVPDDATVGEEISLLTVTDSESAPEASVISAFSARMLGAVSKETNEDDSVTYKATVGESVPTALIWTGAGGTANWSDGLNWTPTVKPSDSTVSVTFPASVASARVVIDSDVSIAAITNNTITTLSGASVLKSNFIDGTGTLVLNGIDWQAKDNADIVITNNLELAEGSANKLKLASDYNGVIVGNLTGSGKLTVDYRKKNGKGMYLSGDNAAFAGIFEMYNAYPTREYTLLDGARSTSSNAVWFISHCPGKDTQGAFDKGDWSTTAYFGAIQGTLQGGYKKPTFEIGQDC